MRKKNIIKDMGEILFLSETFQKWVESQNEMFDFNIVLPFNKENIIIANILFYFFKNNDFLV